MTNNGETDGTADGTSSNSGTNSSIGGHTKPKSVFAENAKSEKDTISDEKEDFYHPQEEKDPKWDQQRQRQRMAKAAAESQDKKKKTDLQGRRSINEGLLPFDYPSDTNALEMQ